MSFFLFASSILNAAEDGVNMLSEPISYVIAFGLISFFLVSILVYSFLRQKKAIKLKNEILRDQEDKIKFLRKAHAENEYKYNQKENDNEKIVLELKYEITALEEKINDGTKNQVVTKIEAYKNKRDQSSKRVNLS